MRREVKEEVNVEIGKPQYLLEPYFHNSRRNALHGFLSFYAPYDSGEVKLDEDSTDYKWITADDAKNYDLIDGIFGRNKNGGGNLEK